MNPKYVNRFIKAIAIQLTLLILFSLVYYSIINDFKPVLTDGVMEYKDCLLLSSTIQAGIGVTNILPQTNLSTFCTITQQILSIVSAFYIVFTFTIHT